MPPRASRRPRIIWLNEPTRNPIPSPLLACTDTSGWPRATSGLDPAHELVAVRAKDLDDAEVVLAVLGLHELFEPGLRAFAQQALGGDVLGDPRAVEHRVVRGRLVVALGDLAALLERAIDLHAEPLVDRLRDEERLDDEQRQGRHEGDQHERGDELEFMI